MLSGTSITRDRRLDTTEEEEELLDYLNGDVGECDLVVASAVIDDVLQRA